MTDSIWVQVEKRIKKSRGLMLLFLLIAVVMTIFPLLGFFRPVTESMGSWWQRAGAPVAIFAFLAQNKAQHFGALITPGSFTGPDIERLRAKYRKSQQLGIAASTVLTVVGTLIWGYGDLAVKALT